MTQRKIATEIVSCIAAISGAAGMLQDEPVICPLLSISGYSGDDEPLRAPKHGTRWKALRARSQATADRTLAVTNLPARLSVQMLSRQPMIRIE